MTGADIYMKTCKEKALEWNVSPRSVNDMCKKGRIQGAIKEKGSWLIPDDSPKPMDGRVSNGKYIKKNMVAKAEVKSLPIGISDYVRAQEEYYYVDKTLLIKEFLDQKPLVSLFTRPRRFGKTLNMDMLRCFFSNEYQIRILVSILPIKIFGNVEKSIVHIKENIQSYS